MDLSTLINGLKLDHVAKAADIPIATLWRWKDQGRIPGREPVRKLRQKIIEDAVKKLRSKKSKAA